MADRGLCQISRPSLKIAWWDFEKVMRYSPSITFYDLRHRIDGSTGFHFTVDRMIRNIRNNEVFLERAISDDKQH
jgi:hypothetical protein